MVAAIDSAIVELGARHQALRVKIYIYKNAILNLKIGLVFSVSLLQGNSAALIAYTPLVGGLG